MELRKRKTNRLQAFDYSSPGAYFITVCTEHRRNLFWLCPDAAITRREEVILSPWGKLVEQAIRGIPKHYPAVEIAHYVIMPNHIHLLLQIHETGSGRPMVAPTASRVVQQMKGIVTKQIGFPLWQKGFYDHVVREERDFQDIWNYIEANPMKWEEDRLNSRFLSGKE